MSPSIRFALLALLAVLGGAPGCRKQEAPRGRPVQAVEVLTLAPTELRETGEYLGSVTSRQSVNLLPQVSGYVRKVLVRPGDRVKAGAIALELDARQQWADLQSAQAEQRLASANAELAQKTLNRSRALHQEGLTTAQELERVEAEAKAAEEARSAASARVSHRSVQVQFHGVRVPIAGVVGDVLVRVGDYVTASTPLTSITQSDVLEVSVTVPAERARSLKPDTPMELLGSRGEVLVSAPVYFVAPEADPRTQLVEVLGVFQNSVNLRPKELVRTRVVYGTRRALQVPALAIVRQSGQPFVFAVEEKDGATVVRRRPVTLGALGEEAYVIEKGLAAGDRIAVASLQALRDGAPIAAKEPSSLAAARPGAAPTARQD